MAPAPPPVTCPWCGAAPGLACHVLGPRRGWRLLKEPTRCHPSRLKVGA
ncbi:zinc finger domain-containing protein [Nocardioides korecus]